MIIGNLAMKSTPTKLITPSCYSLAISHVMVSTMYLTLNNSNWSSIYDGTYDTTWITAQSILHADWRIDPLTNLPSLYAGNLSYTFDICSKILLQKRYKDEFTWKTVFEQDINSNDDFEFTYTDYLNPCGKGVQYAYVPVVYGAEQPASLTLDYLYPEFEGIFLCEKDVSHRALLNNSNQVSINKESVTTVTLGRQFPFVSTFGNSNYQTGTLETTFIQRVEVPAYYFGQSKNGVPILDEDGEQVYYEEWLGEEGLIYRDTVNAFLEDGKTKILKDWEGRIWMVSTSGTISIDSTEHRLTPKHSIKWVECGDWNSIEDLYDNGLIQTDYDRR